MGTARGTIAAVALATALTMGLAGTALGHVAKPTVTSIKLDGTHGYRVEVQANTGLQKTGTDGVTIAATKSGREVSYSTDKGTSTGRVIKGDLGRYGKVNLRFHPRKTTHPKPPRGCHGRVTRKTGIWKGIVKLHAEGLTSASARKLKGSHTVGLFDCSGQGGGTIVALGAFRADGHFVNFNAFERKKSGAKPFFSASEFMDKGAISIGRFATKRGKPSDFTYSADYSQGHVTPGNPFKGSGTFDNGNWSGTLKVDFLGDRNVPLTGPAFDASLGPETPLKAPASSALAP